MARERYLVGTGNETIHDNEIVLTSKKDIRKNWWYYHKFIVLGVIIAAAVVFSFVYSIVTKVHPDYQIGLLSSVTLPDQVISELQEEFQQYADDRNGDGKVIVQINSYIIGDPETADPNMLQAAVVKFSADVSSGDSIIFLHDADSFEYVQQSGMEGFWLYKDGTPMPEDKTDIENAMFSWDEVPALANYHVQDTGNESVTSGDYDKLLERYRVSLRAKSQTIEKKEETSAYYDDSLALFQRMMEQEKINGKETLESTGTSQ